MWCLRLLWMWLPVWYVLATLWRGEHSWLQSTCHQLILSLHHLAGSALSLPDRYRQSDINKLLFYCNCGVDSNICRLGYSSSTVVRKLGYELHILYYVILYSTDIMFVFSAACVCVCIILLSLLLLFLNCFELNSDRGINC